MHFLSRRAVASLVSLSTLAVPTQSFGFDGRTIRFCADVTRESCFQLEEALRERVVQRSMLRKQLKRAIEADVDMPELPIHL